MTTTTEYLYLQEQQLTYCTNEIVRLRRLNRRLLEKADTLERLVATLRDQIGILQEMCLTFFNALKPSIQRVHAMMMEL